MPKPFVARLFAAPGSPINTVYRPMPGRWFRFVHGVGPSGCGSNRGRAVGGSRTAPTEFKTMSRNSRRGAFTCFFIMDFGFWLSDQIPFHARSGSFVCRFISRHVFCTYLTMWLPNLNGTNNLALWAVEALGESGERVQPFGRNPVCVIRAVNLVSVGLIGVGGKFVRDIPGQIGVQIEDFDRRGSGKI